MVQRTLYVLRRTLSMSNDLFPMGAILCAAAAISALSPAETPFSLRSAEGMKP